MRITSQTVSYSAGHDIPMYPVYQETKYRKRDLCETVASHLFRLSCYVLTRLLVNTYQNTGKLHSINRILFARRQDYCSSIHLGQFERPVRIGREAC